MHSLTKNTVAYTENKELAICIVSGQQAKYTAPV
jgi:predicted transcriptional regulator